MNVRQGRDTCWVELTRTTLQGVVVGREDESYYDVSVMRTCRQLVMLEL